MIRDGHIHDNTGRARRWGVGNLERDDECAHKEWSGHHDESRFLKQSF